MKNMWSTLEERTRTWNALHRQGLAGVIWEDYVSVRFGCTGDPRALEYLYPYLNHADKWTRLKAIEVAARVFEGQGLRAIDALDYFTKNPDPLLRDRAVIVIGAALKGWEVRFVLEALEPYLNHRNQFIRRLAVVALGEATVGQASAKVLSEIQRVAQKLGPQKPVPEWEAEVHWVIAKAFAGRPTEEVYTLLATPMLPECVHEGNPHAMSVLMRNASDEWYERAYREVFEPRLQGDKVEDENDWFQREGIATFCHASPRRGMDALRRMLHLRNYRRTARAILSLAQFCFVGANPDVHREPLMELARNGDVQEQRIAAICLGRLMMGLEDTETLDVLTELCSAKNKAVQSAALTGLGMAARSMCDEELLKLCLEKALVDETAAAGIRAAGMVFLSSGREDVFSEIRAKAELYRRRPVRGRNYCKPLAACYWATGLVYLGTGSMEPVDFLIDVLAQPRVPRMSQYQWSASKALVMIEFSEATLSQAFANPPEHIFINECANLTGALWIGMPEYFEPLPYIL